VDFRNTIVILTSNLGVDASRSAHSFGFAGGEEKEADERMRDSILEASKKTFRPELLNRFDETVVFRKLDSQDMRKILDLELARLQERLKASHIQLSLDRKAADFLVEKGADAALGARPLRRVVQEYVEDPLADLVLSGKSKPRVRGRLAKDGKSIKF
jgi:ATP-dependent Clp protease ATP-binding subunit ClpC